MYRTRAQQTAEAKTNKQLKSNTEGW